MGSDDLVTRLLAAIERAGQRAAFLDKHASGHDRPYDLGDPTDPAVVARHCAVDWEIVEMYAGTVKIRDDALAEMNGRANGNHRSLDTWSRATYEASVLLPVIEALAEGYDLTTTVEVPGGHHDH